MLTIRSGNHANHHSWWVGACTLLVGLLPGPSVAQTVRALIIAEQHDGVRPTLTSLGGRQESASAPGYLVLLTEDGREVGRSINNTGGPVAIQAPRPGEYRLQSQRVGYETVTSAPFQLRSGQIIDMSIDVAIQPVRLNRINLATTECRTHVGQDPILGTLWREIHKALAAVAWAGGAIRYEYTGNLFDRNVNVDGRVTSEQSGPATGPAILGNGLSAATSGQYITTHSEGAGSFLSTGPDYLLSDAFQEDYCFSIAQDPETNLVGLRFAPRRGGDVADVAGTFWVDPASAELHSLEYRAVNLPYDPENRTGGVIRLLHTPTGRWVVTTWRTRIPVVGRESGRDVLLRFRDRGGMLSRITAPGGDDVYQASLAELRGTVVDEKSAPVAGATVELVGTHYTTVTDPNGQFAMSGPFEGEYGVSFHNALLASTGFVPQEELVTLTLGRIDSVRLVMPPLEMIVTPICGGRPHRAGQRIITGVVRDDDSNEILDGARIVAIVNDEEVSTLADSAGFYAICGIPTSVPVDIIAEHEGAVSNTVTLTFDDAGVNREAQLGQSGHQPTTATTWVEDLQVVQLPIIASLAPAYIGFKFGGTSSTISGPGINAKPLSGFQWGMFYENYGRYLGWRIEGAYVQQGAFSPLDGREMTLNYVKLPLLLKVRFSPDASRTLSPYLFGGPAVGFDTKGKRGVPKGDISLMLGGGVTVKAGKFSIIADASYTRGITTNAPPFLREPSQFETRVPKFFEGINFTNRLLSFSIGLAFPMSRNVVGFNSSARNAGRPPTRDLISRVQIDATDLNTVYEVVQRLHPQWLRARGQITLREAGEEERVTSGAVGPVVYVNSARRGDINELRNISVETISEIFYFNGRDASFRFGANHPSGVIQVITR